ncbi:ASST-domain-containing protein [Xylaria sp. CBS 124048]|nr:ASST-domain-containing protein [Xylaria sp. CBS 124048]
MMQVFISVLLAAVGVLMPQATADANLVFDPEGYNLGRYGPDPHQYYHSASIASPLLLVNQWDPAGIDNASHIFLTLDSPVDGGSAGPVIYRSDDLSLVYSEPRWPVVHNAYAGRFNGSDYLVYIGQDSLAHQHGPSRNCLLYDSTYTLAYNVSSHGPGSASMGTHECQLTTNGSVVVILTQDMPFDLTAVGGPKHGKILDNIVQEIDIESNKLLWTWRASEHYNLSESYAEYEPGPWAYDYIHLNSAERTPEGNFLLSSRHTHSIVYVDRASRAIKWRLGGKKNSFFDVSGGKATDFAWQHHARFDVIDRTQLTLFDNHGNSSSIGCEANCTRGKHVELNYGNLTARLVSEFYHPQKLVSAFEGSYQRLDSGNVFLGWGANPTFTEHNATTGECVLDVQFDAWRPEMGYPVNYRAFKMNWKAYPTWDPEIAAHRSHPDGTVKVYVSWNGATEVTMWQVLVGSTRDTVTQSAIAVPRAGFETEISLDSGLPFIRAAALDGNGKVLGTTAIIQLETSEESAGLP